jgi:hypothetical protein
MQMKNVWLERKESKELEIRKCFSLQTTIWQTSRVKKVSA